MWVRSLTNAGFEFNTGSLLSSEVFLVAAVTALLAPSVIRMLGTTVVATFCYGKAQKSQLPAYWKLNSSRHGSFLRESHSPSHLFDRTSEFFTWYFTGVVIQRSHYFPDDFDSSDIRSVS